jgi:hypothetical protein
VILIVEIVVKMKLLSCGLVTLELQGVFCAYGLGPLYI